MRDKCATQGRLCDACIDELHDKIAALEERLEAAEKVAKKASEFLPYLYSESGIASEMRIAFAESVSAYAQLKERERK